MNRLLLSLFVVVFSINSHAGLIVKFKKNKPKSQQFLNLFKEQFTEKELVRELGLSLVTAKNKNLKNQKSLLLKMDNIEYVQEDHPITLRGRIPNDPKITAQWHHEKIGSPSAWDRSTGGANSLGHAPVIAIVDVGVDITHQDLKDNIWVNSNEIAGNGIDDDNNGYVDDINGWNAVSDNGSPQSTGPMESHSTFVAGVAGAVGNNGLDVSGVNWSLKMMTVKALGGSSISLTSQAMKAYSYILKQKQLWLETNGAKGANVVATNSSFGVDGADCNSGEFPAWNDMYNELGKVGILSAAATANANFDIDQMGDVPTGCNSPYLVTVTSTDAQDKKGNAGFGLTTIDLGAPGVDILSTTPGNLLKTSYGTSYATPLVAGAIALLHSSASQELGKLATENPSKAAEIIKGILLKSTDKIPDLEGRTVTGGRLNVSKATESAVQYSAEPPAEPIAPVEPPVVEPAPIEPVPPVDP